MHAKLLRRLAAEKPRAIAYDIQFSEPSEPEREADDIALLEGILATDGKTVLATTEVNQRGEAFLGVPELLKDIKARLGNGPLPNDPGGVLRRVSFSVDRLETLAVATTEVATGKPVDPASFDGEPAWIDYYGPRNTLKGYSFSRVLNGEFEKGLFRDKIMVVGPTAPTLQDLHPTSTSGDNDMAGAEIQASAIDTVRRGLPLRSVPGALEVALIVLLGPAPAASLRFSPLRSLAVASGWRSCSSWAPSSPSTRAGSSPWSTRSGRSWCRRSARSRCTTSPPPTSASARDVLALRARERGRRRAGQCPRPAAHGVQREGTVMFSDLRGFTSFAESLPVDRVIDILNRYLTGMSDAILDHGGTLVAYMGDGIMAVFGAPIEQPDHADRALAASRAMLGEQLDTFNQYLRDEALRGLPMGIGLNSGPVASGNGSERRLEYTAIGDTTNTAARLEGMTKGTPHQLFVADSTRSFLQTSQPDLVFVDEFAVRGRQAKIKLWALEDERSSAPPLPGTTPAAARE